jgi:NADH-quinone oxidoreductase subunit N
MNISAILPEVVLAIGAALVMTIDAMTGGRRNIGWLAALTVMVAGGVVISQFNQIEAGFDGMVLADRFAHLMRLVIYLGTLLALLTAIGAWNARGSSSVFGAEHYGLLLIAVVGMDLLVLSADMTILFLGLEILSIPLYGMAAGRLGSDRSVEAGAKYFLNGAFASGFVLFGIALVYGAAGTFSYEQIGRTLLLDGDATAPLWWIGGLLIAVGFFFKIAAAPFHAWAPDVYAGAPTPTVAFFAAAPKVAALGLLVRLTQTMFVDLPMQQLLWGVAWLSMLVGNLLALRQRELKRLLAYSGIAHMGYALVALVAGGSGAVGAIGFYLLGYTGMAVGSFAVACAVGYDGGEVTLERLAGLGKRQPWTAAMMSVFMFALAGIPPTVGFVGKFVLFSEAVGAGHWPLVIWAVLFSALSLYYYLRVVVAMWMWEATEDTVESSAGHAALRPVLVLASLITLIPGVFPQYFLAVASKSLFWLS